MQVRRSGDDEPMRAGHLNEVIGRGETETQGSTTQTYDTLTGNEWGRDS